MQFAKLQKIIELSKFSMAQHFLAHMNCFTIDSGLLENLISKLCTLPCRNQHCLSYQRYVASSFI